MAGLVLDVENFQMSGKGLNIKKSMGERVLLMFTHLHREIKSPEGRIC
jgi:hypothetical protein